MIMVIIYNTDEAIQRGQIMKEKAPVLLLCTRSPSRQGDASVPSELLLKLAGKFRDIRCLLMGEGCRLLGGLLPALGLC